MGIFSAIGTYLSDKVSKDLCYSYEIKCLKSSFVRISLYVSFGGNRVLMDSFFLKKTLNNLIRKTNWSCFNFAMFAFWKKIGKCITSSFKKSKQKKFGCCILKNFCKVTLLDVKSSTVNNNAKRRIA